jgi:hypothetical protein
MLKIDFSPSRVLLKQIKIVLEISYAPNLEHKEYLMVFYLDFQIP